MNDTVEKVYYDEGGFRVTSARFVAGNTTYPMGTIQAVSKNVKPAELGGVVAALWLGWICGVAGVVAMIGTGLQGEGAGCSWTLLVLGVFLIPIGHGAKRGIHTTYSVEVSTAAGTTQAITSRSEADVDRIVEALNHAIVDRG